MAKQIDAKTRSYFPTISKNSTYGDVWDKCIELGYEIDFYDKILGDRRPYDKQLDIVILQNESSIHKFSLKGQDRDSFVNEFDYDWEKVYRVCVDWLIANKYLKKPKNVSKLIQEHQEGLQSLIRERDRLTMKIYTWKKIGKDVTELEVMKTDLNAKIKSMR